jgi:hypothetical protein
VVRSASWKGDLAEERRPQGTSDNPRLPPWLLGLGPPRRPNCQRPLILYGVLRLCDIPRQIIYVF